MKEKFEACPSCGAVGFAEINHVGKWFISCSLCKRGYVSRWLWLVIWQRNHVRRKQLRVREKAKGELK